MKHIFLYILFFFTVLQINAQTRLVADTSNVNWVTINDSTYSASLTLFSDLTGMNYTGLDIADTFRVFTDQEQVYRISTINNQTISSIDFEIIEFGEDYGAPQGQIIIYDHINRTTVPQGPFATNGAFNRLHAAIDTWNAKQDTIDAVTVGNIIQDTTLQYLNPPNQNGFFAVWDSINNQINWVEEVIPPTDSTYFSNDFLGDGSIGNPIKFNDKGAIAGEVMTWNGTEWVPQAKGNGIYGGSDTLSSNTTVTLDNYTLNFDASANTISDSLFFYFEDGSNKAGFASDNSDEIYLRINQIENINGDTVFNMNNNLLTIGDVTQDLNLNFNQLFYNYATPPAPSLEDYYLSWDQNTNEVTPILLSTVVEGKGWLKDSLAVDNVEIDANNNYLEFNNLSYLAIGDNISQSGGTPQDNLLIGEDIILGSQVSRNILSGNNLNVSDGENSVYIGASNINVTGINTNIGVIAADSIVVNNNTFTTFVTGKNHTTNGSSNSIIMGDGAKPYDDLMFIRGAGKISQDNILGNNQIFETQYLNRFIADADTDVTIGTLNIPLSVTNDRMLAVEATILVVCEQVGSSVSLNAGDILSFTVNKSFVDIGGVRTSSGTTNSNFLFTGVAFGASAFNILSNSSDINFIYVTPDDSSPTTQFKVMVDVKIQEISIN